MTKNLLTGRTRCLLIRPEFLKDTFYNLTDVVSLLGAKSAAPPLGLLIVAALLPEHWELRFVDHDVTPLRDSDLDWADVVMVGGIGPQQLPMMRIVRQAKAMGKLTVVGGSGPTLQPQLFTDADVVIIGEAEETVPRWLEDLGAGARGGTYRSESYCDLTKSPTPRYDLALLDAYMFVGVNYSRGCPFNCEFCAQVEVFGRKPRTKTVPQTIAELDTIYRLGYRGMIDFGYDNLIGDTQAITEVLRAMHDYAEERRHPFCYSTEATVNLAREPEILELMRANDFRFLFVGIESAEEEVWEQMKKGQNKSVPTEEAVRIFNAHGMVVYTGLIVGFDSETDKTAQAIVDMVQKTGAFPALVLPLHALPNTQLSRRLEREGRLFAGGEVVMNTERRTDTATTGLNFVTTRPRGKVLGDLANVLEQLYQPSMHYQRTMFTATQLEANHKYRPDARELLKLARAFVRIATTLGIDRDIGPLFWRTLLKVTLTNPGALEMTVALAVMHANYAAQSVSYVEALRRQIRHVDEIGEEEFNARHLAPPRASGGARRLALA
jgi:radical SAM superfamily enzyme YgiQ (UPF0313 family)